MVLHIAAQDLPLRAASTKRGAVMKVGMLRSETQEFVVIVNIFFGSVAKQEPQLSSLMARLIAQQPVQHRAKRRDARAGRNENRVAYRRAQDEVTERALATNLILFFHVAEKVRHEPVLHAIKTECEARIVSRWGRD